MNELKALSSAQTTSELMREDFAPLAFASREARTDVVLDFVQGMIVNCPVSATTSTLRRFVVKIDLESEAKRQANLVANRGSHSTSTSDVG